MGLIVNTFAKFIAFLGGIILMLLILGSSHELFGQIPSPYVRQQYFTNSGAVCNACTITTSLTGTGTASSVYADSGLLTAFANPMTLNSAGRPTTNGTTEATIFLDSAVTYRFILRLSDGTTVWTVDGIRSAPTTTFSLTSGRITKGSTDGTTVINTTCLSESGTAITLDSTCTMTGDTTTRFIIPPQDNLVISSGTPVTTTVGTGATVVAMGGTSNSGITVNFQVPVDAAVANTIVLTLGYSVRIAPGVTNNRVRLITTATVNATAAAPTAGESITLANNTTPASYLATLNLVAASTYAIRDNVAFTILRDTSVANNYPDDFYVRLIGFQYVSNN